VLQNSHVKRQILALIQKDLQKKMVFLIGPRQVGKTWLAKELIKTAKKPQYLNYDSLSDRQLIHQEAWLPETDLLVFDELHKMPKWKQYLKGVFDTKSESCQILVTGSARLDTFLRAGDSLAGRYFIHHLFPFSPMEWNTDEPKLAADIDRFCSRGGFPEPLLAESAIDADRWRAQYVDSLVREDFIDLAAIQDLRSVQSTLDLLRRRVGSPISYSSLAEDVGVAPNTIKKYITVFEALYIVFRVTPFSKHISRSLLKSPKLYFYDTGLVIGDNGAQFENLMALSLHDRVTQDFDRLGRRSELHYLKTKEKKEVDFCLVADGKPVQLIEAKVSDPSLSSHLIYYAEKYGIPASQIVWHLKNERIDKHIKVLRAENFLRGN